MKKVFSLLLALMLVMSLAVPAFASSVQTAGPGSVNFQKNKTIHVDPRMKTYTDTDLFGSFKSLMPGDTRGETVTIKNWCLQYDYVTVYMEARRHPEEELISSDPKYGKNLEQMHDFLSKLDMTVTSKDKEIFSASPDQEGALSEPVKIGNLGRGKSMTLDVSLYWYPDANCDEVVGNEYDYNLYANRVGEVDWVFTFEGHNYPSDIPKTGDYIMMAVAIMAVSAAALVVIFATKRKKKK